MAKLHHLGVAAAAALALAGLTRAASAADCDPNALYLQIGDTQEPVIKALGKKLVDSSVFPFRIVYVTSGSCTNIDAMYTGAPINTNMLYIPSASEDPSWNPSKPSPTCTLPAPHPIDVANSNVFVSTCTSDPVPAGLKLFQASIQAYVFVVPEMSQQAAITAEEAYFVFGYGMQGQAEPWVDESFYFVRPPDKSTVQCMAKNIDVDAAYWKGVPLDKSSQVLTDVATSSSPEKTIGILGVEIYDGARSVTN
ncbi:MAG TPA: hypothetical protein VHB21_07950, partial [Minicystis sp.]|nr:hypothetical protein [Minicystis sp.]